MNKPVLAIVVASLLAGMITGRLGTLYFQRNAELVTNQSSVVDTAAHISSTERLADCKSAIPVIALDGKKTDVTRSHSYVYDFYCHVLSDDPTTFVALNVYYGKDAKSVYTIIEDEGGTTPHKIEGADPISFQLIPDPGDPNAIDGYSALYTKDKDHVYWEGYGVPGIRDITPVSPPRICSTCVFDAQVGDTSFYYRGQLMGSSISL